MLDTALFWLHFLLRQHARTHTTTLAQNLLAFAWHHGMERTKRGWGRGRGGGWRSGPKKIFMETAMHAPQRSEGDISWVGIHYTTL